MKEIKNKYERNTRISRVKVLLIIVCFFPLLFLFTYIHYSDLIRPKNSNQIFFEMIENEECTGKIEFIYRQRMNHNILSLKTKKCEHTVPGVWENKFHIGDSISKKKGELILAHYRNGKLIENLDYQELRRKH